jgi:hypothetical protein
MLTALVAGPCRALPLGKRAGWEFKGRLPLGVNRSFKASPTTPWASNAVVDGHIIARVLSWRTVIGNESRSHACEIRPVFELLRLTASTIEICADPRGIPDTRSAS